MPIFTLAFWANAFEHAIVAGAAALGGAQIFTGGALNARAWEAAGVTAGIAALYALVQQIGGVQLANGVMKVGVGKHAASPQKAAERVAGLRAEAEATGK